MGFAPRKGQFCHSNGGQGILHARCGNGPQVLVPCGKPGNGAAYRGSQADCGVWLHCKRGRRFFRTCDWFNADTSVEYLKAMQRHFGMVAAVVDRVSPIEQNWSGSYCGKTRTSGSYTFQKDRRTSSGRGTLASGKASSARLRILQDPRRHAQCNLHVL